MIINHIFYALFIINNHNHIIIVQVILAARLCLTKCHKAVSNKQEEIIEKPELLEKIFETAERMKIDSIHQYQVRNLTRKKRKKKMKDLNQQYYVDKVKGRQTQDEYHLDLIE